MKFDVFISYASNDKPVADAACAIVERSGIRCWIAPRDIAPGADYATALSDALENCRALVLIFSGGANESPHIRREVERAVSRGIPLIPVRIENIKPSAALKYFVGSVHWLDALSPPMEQHFEILAKTLRVVLEEAGNPQAPLARLRQDGPVAADPETDKTRLRRVFRARFSAGIGLGFGVIFTLIATLVHDTASLLLDIGGTVGWYFLLYRNIPRDLKTAKLILVIFMCVGGYFIITNTMNQLWVYVILESLDLVVAIYTVYQIDALQKLPQPE